MKEILFRENYHTHTYLCRHAEGTMREYVERALARGMTALGFSDHAPYSYGGVYDSFFRMFPNEVETYIGELTSLREEFRGKIDIKIGYETEFYPKYFDTLVERVCSYPCDYMILGQHFTNNEYDGEYVGDHGNEDAVRQYVKQVCDGMRTGYFSFVAHPNLVNYNGDMDTYLELTSDICRVSLETDTPLELNLSSFRRNKDYPKNAFWETAARYGCKVVMGLDVHEPEVFDQTEDLEVGISVIRQYGLNYIESPTLRAPAQVLRNKNNK